MKIRGWVLDTVLAAMCKVLYALDRHRGKQA